MIKIDTKEKYDLYISTLKKWQNAVNLISPSTLNDVYNRHILDGVMLSNYIKSQFEIDIKIIDVGSGAGFPGMVLSIEGFKNVTLIESDSKKVSFLNNIKIAYNLKDVEIINKRVEEIKETPKIITSRAFKSVKETLELSINMINYETNLVLLKGQNAKNEINEALQYFQFNYNIIKNENPTSDGYILHIKNIALNSKTSDFIK